jgi:uncharacterized protein
VALRNADLLAGRVGRDLRRRSRAARRLNRDRRRIVIVPVVYYGLVASGTSADQAAHIAVATSLAAILPTAVVSSLGHWRAGNMDLLFLRQWGPGIALGVVAAQLAAPHLRGSIMTGIFSLLCLIFAGRFAFPGRFRPITEKPPAGGLRNIAGAAIGLFSGIAGVGRGILTNIVMSLSGMPIHKSIGRAAAAGVVVSIPATIVAALASWSATPSRLGCIDVAVWASIAPAQACAAWIGTRLAQRLAAANLSRVMAAALLTTGIVMLHSSIGSQWAEKVMTIIVPTRLVPLIASDRKPGWRRRWPQSPGPRLWHPRQKPARRLTRITGISRPSGRGGDFAPLMCHKRIYLFDKLFLLRYLCKDPDRTHMSR